MPLLCATWKIMGIGLAAWCWILWGSQTMRTGGEEFGAALALLGVRPNWDPQSFRVTGFEIVPLMKLDRPRVDVTLRISGLMRDMFPGLLTFFMPWCSALWHAMRMRRRTHYAAGNADWPTASLARRRVTMEPG